MPSALFRHCVFTSVHAAMRGENLVSLIGNGVLVGELLLFDVVLKFHELLALLSVLGAHGLDFLSDSLLDFAGLGLKGIDLLRSLRLQALDLLGNVLLDGLDLLLGSLDGLVLHDLLLHGLSLGKGLLAMRLGDLGSMGGLLGELVLEGLLGLADLSLLGKSLLELLLQSESLLVELSLAGELGLLRQPPLLGAQRCQVGLERGDGAVGRHRHPAFCYSICRSSRKHGHPKEVLGTLPWYS